ncbi:MAG: hypothetical protein KGJ60_13900 [Verrucomicrobiota bacterium]|nr:hypothetical protein [Verrucomicrobiota bacterium]
MSQTICKHLRTKRIYIDATPEEAFADKNGAEASPCHFWCNLTQTVVGADDRPAHKATCNASRRCFEE